MKVCIKGHTMPDEALLCAQCGSLAKPPLGVRLGEHRVMVIGFLFLLLCICGLAVYVTLKDDIRPMSHVASAQRYQAAVFQIECYDEEGEETGQGSGVLLDSMGTALTAFHVIQGYSDASAVFQGGRKYGILSVVAYDTLADIAVIKVGRDGEGGVQHPRVKAYPEMRAPVQPRMGEAVVAIGSPKGFANTVSEGIVSGTRYIDEGPRLQITAPISPGSSGGPLFDSRGRIIGLTVEVWAADKSQNLNFASPVTPVVQMLQSNELMPLAEFGPKTKETEESGTFADRVVEWGTEEFLSHRYENALKLYLYALREDERHVWAHYCLARCLDELGRPKDALRYLEAYKKLLHDTGSPTHRYAMELEEKLRILAAP